VTLTGVSVSLYEVSGASKRGTIDESETNNPTTTIVQRRYFKGTPQVARMLLASGLCVKVKQIARRTGAFADSQVLQSFLEDV
jgi:hypothetical protein